MDRTMRNAILYTHAVCAQTRYFRADRESELAHRVGHISLKKGRLRV